MLLGLGFAALAGCASREPAPVAPQITAVEGRALVAKLLPASLADRAGWATDIYAAMTALGIPPRAENICAVIAITEQESGFRANPSVPNLGQIAWK
jgi:hypothetical protein